MAKSKSSFAGMSYRDIMMQQATNTALAPRYCRYCGKDVNSPSDKQPETDWRQNLDWERKYQAHVRCHSEHTMRERGMR